MIRGTIPYAPVLIFCLGMALTLGAANLEAQVNAAPKTRIQDKNVRDSGGAVHGDAVSEAESKDAAEGKSVQTAGQLKGVKRLQKFVDEDGDGYNDRRPDTVSEMAAGAGNADHSKAKNEKQSEMRMGNAGEHGPGKGMDSPGLGISGALERGMKMGQNSDGKSTYGFGKTDGNDVKNNIPNNGKNRFDRNFEKYNRPSMGKMGEGSGKNK